VPGKLSPSSASSCRLWRRLPGHRLEANLSRGAVDIVSGDFLVDPSPAGQDTVLMAIVIRLSSPDLNRALLRRARMAMEPVASMKHVTGRHAIACDHGITGLSQAPAAC
jgi:hypothetical protein